MQTQTLDLTRLEALEVRRKRLEWTQNELSRRAGYSASYGRQVQAGYIEAPDALAKMEAVVSASLNGASDSDPD